MLVELMSKLLLVEVTPPNVKLSDSPVSTLVEDRLMSAAWLSTNNWPEPATIENVQVKDVVLPEQPAI
jgi:hypothetical protein